MHPPGHQAAVTRGHSWRLNGVLGHGGHPRVGVLRPSRLVGVLRLGHVAAGPSSGVWLWVSRG